MAELYVYSFITFFLGGGPEIDFLKNNNNPGEYMGHGDHALHCV